MMILRWYNAAKADLGTETTWTAQDNPTATWQRLGGNLVSPANAFYVSVRLLNANYVGTLYFDEVKFSQIRAATPTAGTVSVADLVIQNYTHTDNLWQKVADIVTVAVDTELYLVFTQFFATAVGLSNDLYARVSDGTTNYPNDNGFRVPLNSTFKYASALISIPKNCNGKLLSLYAKAATITGTAYSATIQGWGHTPHTHV
jgi:hypothetical protein